MHWRFFAVMFSAALFVVVFPLAVRAQAATTPTLTTDAIDTATLPDGTISDTATLSGATSDASGDITFKVYGPFDPTTDPTTDQCIDSGTEANLVTTLGPVNIGSPDAATGNYTISSGNYTPTAVGRYQWVASYTSGDANNTSVSTDCNDPNEQSLVNSGADTTLTLTTEATASATLGDPISDTATLSGGDNPTGTITFNAYGPHDADCSGDSAFAFTSTVNVTGNGDYSSDPTPNDPSDDFVPSVAGTYRWTADYSGDANNEAVTSACNAENEQSVVNDGGGGGDGGGNNDHNHNNNRNNNDNNRNNNDNNRNNNDNNRNNNNNNAVHDQYTSQRTLENAVIKDTIPNKGLLANTGGMPLAGVALLALAMVGLGISVLRSAIRRDR